MDVDALGARLRAAGSALSAARRACDAGRAQRALSTPGTHVLDTTGSVVYLPTDLITEIHASCHVVYLHTPPARHAAMLQRYINKPKPVVWRRLQRAAAGVAASRAAALLREMLTERHRRYLALAHVVLDAAELEAHDPGVQEFLARCTAGVAS